MDVTTLLGILVAWSALVVSVMLEGGHMGAFINIPAGVIVFGGTIVALAMLAISSSPIAPSDIQRPIPALQSYWLVLHVTCSFIGEAFFTVAFAASIYFLVTKDEEKRKNLDRVIYTSIGIGYPIFTAGALIFGATREAIPASAITRVSPIQKTKASSRNGTPSQNGIPECHSQTSRNAIPAMRPHTAVR